MALIIVEPSVIILMNTIGRISITIQNTAEADTDPSELQLDVLDLGGTVRVSDTWPAPSARIVRTAVGKFYINFGDLLPNEETNYPYEWVFNWRVTMVPGGPQTQSIQKVKVISAKMASLIPDLRILIDKSRKLVAPSSECFLGYTEANLVTYLQAGLEEINAYQPSLTFRIENFPFEYRQILVDAGLVVGVISQQLFAIDTDIPSYNDNGTAFVITHQAQLAAFLNQMTQRLDRLIPQMKLQLLQPGAVHIKMGPSFRLNTLISAAPGGALFRNLFFTP